MILQALTDYYKELAKKGKITRPGWVKVTVSFALILDEDGKLTRILSLSTTMPDGKKSMPQELELPAPVKRTVGIAPNFLWDNSAYLLGFDGKGKPERSKDCFAAAKNMHLELLKELDEPFAKAICRFFESWEPDTAESDAVFADCLEDIKKGSNLVFLYDGRYPGEDEALCRAWQAHYDGAAEGALMRCLVTGEEVMPENTHPSIKNVMGAQSSGAALVSFNAPAFCSYGREQNFNAPVGKYAAFAYTTALNTLLADKDHVLRLGDTTVVFWAQEAQPAYQTSFGSFFSGDGMSDDELKGCMKALAQGRPHNFDGVTLMPNEHFYVLGLAPNAARLSVRFFLRDSFGAFAQNLQRHYDRMKVIQYNDLDWKPISPFAMLQETVNIKAKNPEIPTQMAADTMKAIMTDSRYPETLYQQTMLRMRATQDGLDRKNRPVYKISNARIQIIKAFLIKNRNFNITEDLRMEDCDTAFRLGMLFSLLENIQRTANPKLNTTIRDRYYNSASSTPYIAFPTLLRLKNNHLKVVGRERPKLAAYFENEIARICKPLGYTFPRILTIEEQGAFALGYYKQRLSKNEIEGIEKSTETLKEEN